MGRVVYPLLCCPGWDWLPVQVGHSVSPGGDHGLYGRSDRGLAGLVLTVGLLALGIVPFTRTVVPGSVRFVNVYDSGAAESVIAVPATITEDQLTATLQQAASDLFSPGRLSRGQDKLTIRARAILHPEPGISQPLYLGEVKRSLYNREDDQMAITLYRENLAKLPQPSANPAS